jgi:hypothetical protein
MWPDLFFGQDVRTEQTMPAGTDVWYADIHIDSYLSGSGSIVVYVRPEVSISVQYNYNSGAIEGAGAGGNIGAAITGDTIHVAAKFDGSNRVYCWFKRNFGDWNASNTADPESNTGASGAYQDQWGSLTKFAIFGFGNPQNTTMTIIEGHSTANVGWDYTTDSGSIALSNGDSTCAWSSATGSVYTNARMDASGNVSFSVRIDDYTSGQQYIGFGVEGSGTWVGYRTNTGEVEEGGTPACDIGAAVDGDIIDCVAQYFGAGEFGDDGYNAWFRRNGGDWNDSGSADPTTNTGGIYFGTTSVVRGLTETLTSSVATFSIYDYTPSEEEEVVVFEVVSFYYVDETAAQTAISNNVIWHDTVQTEADWDDGNIWFAAVEHPVGNSLGSGGPNIFGTDAGGASLSRVVPPEGGGWCIRHYGDTDSWRAQYSGASWTTTAFGNQIAAANQIWLEWEVYFPNTIPTATGTDAWMSLVDWHSHGSSGEDWWATDTSLMMCTTLLGCGANTGHVRARDYTNLIFSPASPMAIPADEWVKIQQHFIWSESPVNITYWINGVQACVLPNVTTKYSTHTQLEYMIKSYGTDGAGSWTPSPMVYYTRNVKLGSGFITS